MDTCVHHQSLAPPAKNRTHCPPTCARQQHAHQKLGVRERHQRHPDATIIVACNGWAVPQRGMKRSARQGAAVSVGMSAGVADAMLATRRRSMAMPTSLPSCKFVSHRLRSSVLRGGLNAPSKAAACGFNPCLRANMAKPASLLACDEPQKSISRRQV